MAFDDRGSGGFGDTRRVTAGAGAAALSRGNSSRVQSYQGSGENPWTSVCGRIEDELRRFSSLTATLKKNVDTIGSARDSEDIRSKITAAVAKGKDAVADVSGLLKTSLSEASAADDPSLSQKEKAARKVQQQRFEKDWLAASTAFKDVS